MLRRWSWLVLVGTVIGVAVGWVSAPGRAGGHTGTFRATHTLFLVRPVTNPSRSAQLSTLLATLGPVPDRVAARLGIDRHQIRSMVSSRPGPPGVLYIIVRSADRAQAEAVANVTAEELIVELGGKESPFETLEPAVATLSEDQFSGPTSRPSRALMLGALGALLGVGAAFGVDRFDNRVRSKEAIEKALHAPVVGEVRQLPPPYEARRFTDMQPSPTVEAYRRLRTNVDQWATNSTPGTPIIVVQSPTGCEGTTTTVAYLAALLGEVGRSVVAVSADLRRPRLHLHFDRSAEPGLSDVLRGAPDTRRLTDLNLATSIRGVQFVASGSPVRNPGPLIDRISDHLDDARSLGDLVLVDAPPLLATSDGADLARQADGVLLVVGAGRTSIGAVRRSAEVLDRLGVAVIGAVLVV